MHENGWRCFNNVDPLDHVYRQQGDSENAFLMALHRLSRDESTVEDWESFMARIPSQCSIEENTSFDSSFHLFPNNASVDEYNQKMAEKHGRPVLASRAKSRVTREEDDDDADPSTHDDVISIYKPSLRSEGHFMSLLQFPYQSV